MIARYLIRFGLLIYLVGFAAAPRLLQAQELSDGQLLSDEAIWDESDWDAVTDDTELPVARFKKGFFQKFQFGGGWVGSTDNDGLSIGTVDASMAAAVPLGSFENLLVVAPKFRVDFLDGPDRLELPSQVYDTGVSFLWRKQINDRWGLMTVATPAVRSDFEATENTVRVFALGLATWQWIPDKLEISFGAVYLDRNDISVLPAAGLRARPSPCWLIDVMFPRPKVAYRISKDGPRSELWGYFAGALGGNTWAVMKDGVNDELTIRGYRLLLGLESICDGGSGAFVEIGYAFDREVEYEIADETYEFGGAFLAQAGIAY